jgi:putative acetyltransferase
MNIRPETPADCAAIRNILLAAFADHPYSRQTEHLIVEALRAAGAMTVGLVAEVDGRVVGQIAFSPAQIDGKDCPWYMLGPIAVEPSLQRQGIGQALLREGLEQLRNLGAHGCALVGDPAYYHRFGFRNTPELTLEGVPPEYFMVLRLNDQFPIPKGQLTHHPAFMGGL